MTISYRAVALASVLSNSKEIEASGGTLFPYGRVGGDCIGIGSIVSSPVKDMASVFAFGIDSGGGSCHVDGGPFDTKALVANNTGANRKVGEAVSSFSFAPSDALIAAIEDVYFGSFKVKDMGDGDGSIFTHRGGADRKGIGIGGLDLVATGVGGGDGLIQTSSHGGGSIMSMYESTATGLGGGGGLEDGGWGDGLAKDLQELVETEGVGMNFEGTNGGEESGLMADNNVLSLAATGSGGYLHRDWVEPSVESGRVIISGGNGGQLLPLWTEEMIDIAAKEGGISANGGEKRWRGWLGLAKEDGSGVFSNLVGGIVGWTGGSRGGVKDVSGVAGGVGVVDELKPIHNLSEGESGVFPFTGVLWHDSVQVCVYSHRDGVVLSSEKTVENGTIGDEIESGDDGLEHPSSKLIWIQKIISSSRMGGISGPLLIQSSILFDDLATGVVDDGVENETVVVRGEDGVPTHSTVNEEELYYVSKPEVSKDEPGSNLSNNDGQELGLNAQVNMDMLNEALEARDISRKSDCTNFLVALALFLLIIVMIMASASSFFFSSRLRSVIVVLNRVLNSYARALYDRGCKTLKAVLLKSVPNLIHPKLKNHSGGKSRRKGRGMCKSCEGPDPLKVNGGDKIRTQGRGKGNVQAQPVTFFKGYHSLLVALVVTVSLLSTIDIGEARWLSNNYNGGAVESVKELLDDYGSVGRVSMETDSGIDSSFDQDTAVDVLHAATSNKVQDHQAVLNNKVVESGDIGLQDNNTGSKFIRSSIQQVASDSGGKTSDGQQLPAVSSELKSERDSIRGARLLQDPCPTDGTVSQGDTCSSECPDSCGAGLKCDGSRCVECTASTDCDDDNLLTIDTCGVEGKCEYECNDNNACTREDIVDGVCQYLDDCEGGTCVPGLIECDDDDQLTMDFCLEKPQGAFAGGCNHIDVLKEDVDTTFALIEKIPEDDVYFFQDEVSISEDRVLSLLKWIKVKILADRTPFCWRQSYGRGVGKVLSRCTGGKERIGALCYEPCKTGYSRQGTFDCQQECKKEPIEWRDDGLFCRLPEYDRGAGYPWKFEDGLNDDGMKRRCNSANKDGCEKYGLIYYPKCKAGYDNFGCCICRPDPTPDCAAEGYGGNAFFGLSLSCAVKITPGDPTPLECQADEEEDAGLCYPPCREEFDGVGPVCWQECGNGQVNCGAGCAATSSDCALAVGEQVLAPLVVAANIATWGGVGAVDTAVDTIEVSGKTVQVTSKTGRFFVKAGRFAVNLLQTVSPSNLKKGASLVTRIKVARTGKLYKKVLLASKVASNLYAAYTVADRAFANDFVEATTQEIADKLDTELDPLDAYYVKTRWAAIQKDELAESQAWAIADITAAGVGVVDISGATDLVNAYTKPKCELNFPFPEPTEETNIKPTANCADVTIKVDRNSHCKGEASALIIGEMSTDDSLPLSLAYFIDGEKDVKEVSIFNAPYTVEITVEDDLSLTDTCQATVFVIDETQATITCPNVDRQNVAPGSCSAVVVYNDPEVTDNCVSSSSSTSQIAGKPSGSAFSVGVTSIIYQVETSSAGVDTCSFTVSVFDDESPSISCDGLATVRPTDKGVCTTDYVYTQPIGTDNCDGFESAEGAMLLSVTTQTSGPPFSSPYVFPADTTTNVFRVFDDEGNSAMCSFDVTIEDREKPTILCPQEAIRPCSMTLPKDSGFAETTDNCEEREAPVLTYSDDTSDGITGTCPEITMRTWLSTDWKNNSNDCTQRIIEVEPDALTDATSCSYESDTFRTVFEPEPDVTSNRPIYRLGSTAPGKFIYHAFHVGEPGQIVTFSIQIPYPFVTQGISSVFAYDWLDIEPGPNNAEPCFLPAGQKFFESDIQVTLDDYSSGQCGDSKQVLLEVVTPSTGFIHLLVNLDFGLIGITNVKLGPRASWRDDGNGGVVPKQNPLLQDRCQFEFSTSGNHEAGNRLVENVNVYKRNQGVSGFVRDAFQNPVSGVTVSLFFGQDEYLSSSVTDQDGYYDIILKPNSRKGNFVVKTSNQAKSIYVKRGNDINSINFLLVAGSEDDVQADSEVLVETVPWEAEPTDCKEGGESAPGGCSGGSNPGCCSGACSKKSVLCRA